jgi:uncharacterized membrane protein YgdD (TMEM256/DUF423 family)
VKAKAQKGKAPSAMQLKMRFSAKKPAEGDVFAFPAHFKDMSGIKRKSGWLKETLENHKLITGLAMLVFIPLLVAIAVANIHNPHIIDGVLAFVGGLYGLHLWKRKHPPTTTY